MFLHVTYAEYLRDYRIRISFNDASQGDVDLSTSLSGPIFEPLRNLEYFKTFSIDGHTLTWPNGADFAPEYLHPLMQVQASSSADTGSVVSN
jgi:hypothetical protein